MLFNILRFYVVVLIDFDEKRNKNGTRPFVRLCSEGSWLTKFNSSEFYRKETAWKRINAFCIVVWPEFGSNERVTEI